MTPRNSYSFKSIFVLFRHGAKLTTLDATAALDFPFVHGAQTAQITRVVKLGQRDTIEIIHRVSLLPGLS